MAELKYIIIDDKYVVLFDKTLTHKDMARNASGMPPTSAGFCMVEPHPTEDKISVYVYGRSESLNMDSNREKDEPLIEKIVNSYW